MSNKYTEDDLREELKTKEYEYGFYTDIESETFPIGLNEDIIRAISKKKEEPQWMTDWRLEAFEAWKEMVEPEWANVHYEKPDFQSIAYYSAPVAVDPNKTLDDVDPDLLAMYKKLGISVDEQKRLKLNSGMVQNEKQNDRYINAYCYPELWCCQCGNYLSRYGSRWRYR